MRLNLDDLDDALKATKQAWIAGVVSGGLTAVLAIIAISSGGAILGGLVNGSALIDASITLGLSYGVFRKSRTCAVGLLGFYLLNQVLMRIGGLSTSGLGMAVIFTLLFAQGVRGTFAYHRFMRQDREMSAA